MTQQHEKPHTISPVEYGFSEHTRGPDFTLVKDDLMPCFAELAGETVKTEHLTTDQGNELLLTSLIGKHKGLAKVAAAIEEPGQTQYSEQIQGFVLGMAKRIADDNGRGIKSVVGPKETVYYDGNINVSNGRLLRVYMTKVGQAKNVPIYAKIAACRTKQAESRVYRVLGIDGKIKL